MATQVMHARQLWVRGYWVKARSVGLFHLPPPPRQWSSTGPGPCSLLTLPLYFLLLFHVVHSPCSYIAGCFRQVAQSAATRSRWFSLADFFTLKIEAIHSYETSDYTRSTRRHIPEDGILYSRSCESLKSYRNVQCCLYILMSTSCNKNEKTNKLRRKL
jgi:hypothetical protein